MFSKKNPHLIGIDIGSKYLKLAILEKHKSFYSVKAFQKYDIANYVRGYKILDREEILMILRNFIKEQNAAHHKAVVSIANDSPSCSITRLFTIGKLNKAELNSAMEIEAEDRIPLDTDEYEYCWDTIEETADEQRILLTTINKQLLEDYLSLFKDLNLEVILQSKTVSILNNLQETEDVQLIIDMGHSHTEFYVTRGKKIYIVRSISYGGNLLTDTISRYLNISHDEAEDMKIRYGCILENPELAMDENEITLSDIISPQIRLLMDEIRKTIMIAQGDFQLEIDQILLTGGASQLKYLREHIAKETQIATDNWIPYYLSENTDMGLLEEMNYFVTAFGSCFQQFQKPSLHLVFNEKEEKTFDFLNVIIIVLLLLATGTIGSIHLYTSSTYSKLQTSINETTMLVQEGEELKQDIANQISDIQNQINVINNEKYALYEQQSLMDKLTDGKMNYFSHLKTVRSLVPKTVQVDHLSIEGKQITINGTSPNFSDLGYFVKELEYDGTFRNVTFSYEEKDNESEEYVLKVIQFTVKCEIFG